MAILRVSTAVLLGTLFAEPSLASDWYITAGGGQSQLKPNSIDGHSSRVVDKQGDVARLGVGQRFNEDQALEGFYANLGSAKVSAVDNLGVTQHGEIDYEVAGVQFLQNVAGNSGHGLSLHIKGGVGFTGIDSSDNISARAGGFSQLNIGLSAQLNDQKGLGLRLDIDQFGRDTRVLTVNAQGHLGKKLMQEQSLID